MGEEHKVKSEGEPRRSNSGGQEVTWTCTCEKKFTGRSKGSPDMSSRIKKLAARHAETEFRNHLPIR